MEWWSNGVMQETYRNQLSDKDFGDLNELAFKLENGLLKLVEALEAKREKGDWMDNLMVKESNDVYLSGATIPNTPTLQHSTTP